MARITCRLAPSLFVLLFAVQVSDAAAQVSVVQGRTPTTDKYQRFASPMTLNLKVNHVRRVHDSKGLGFGDITKYECEEVSISTLSLLIRSERDGGRTFTFKGSLRVRSGVDQNVGLTFLLIDSESRTLMSIEEPKISAESGEDERFTLRTTVSSTAAQAIDQAKDLNLQIVMRVKRD